jgi:hypothetical protein
MNSVNATPSNLYKFQNYGTCYYRTYIQDMLVFVLQGRVECPQHNDPLPMSGPTAPSGAGVQWCDGCSGQETHTARCEWGGAAWGTAGSHGPIR